MTKADLLIWWLNQRECEAVYADAGIALPPYIRKQVESRYGGPGRGRLWVPDDFPEVSVDPWPDTPLAAMLGGGYGGIVFAATDLAAVRPLPGTVTDMALNKV